MKERSYSAGLIIAIAVLIASLIAFMMVMIEGVLLCS